MNVVTDGNASIVVRESPNAVVVSGGTQGLPGVAGAPGQNGTDAGAWLSGIVAPNNALGNDGQIYINTATGQVYRKTAGIWNIDFTLSATSIDWVNVTNKPTLYTEFNFNDARHIVINHNLGTKPGGIRVVDTGGNTWEGFSVNYVDANNLVITFNYFFGGTVYLS